MLRKAAERVRALMMLLLLQWQASCCVGVSGVGSGVLTG